MAIRKPVAFGEVNTDGGFRLERDRLIPLPDSGAFSARLRGKSFAPAEAAMDESGAVLRAVAVSREGEEVVLSCEPGVFAYRLVESR